MATPKENKDHQVIEMLDSLRETPPRDPRAAERGRANFLVQARSMQKAVSPNPFRRLNNWIATIPLIRYRKERSPMFATITSIIIALAVVLGGGGITAFAAQDSLPNDALYPVKLYLEDARLSLTGDPDKQIGLLTAFANNRIDEITGLALQGEAVPNGVVTRLQNNLQNMLRLAAGLDEEATVPALQQIRENLRTQEQLMSQLEQPEELDPALEQLRAMLQEQHRLTQLGLEEPLKFQQMYRHYETESPGEPPDGIEPKGNQNGDCTEPGDCIPVGDGPGPGGEGPGDGNAGDNGNQGPDNGSQTGGKGSGPGK
jgi:hypothetical protein